MSSGSPTLLARNLHSLLSSSSHDSSTSIVSVSSSVHAFLLSLQPPESALLFFRLCFPVLLQRLFGLTDSPSPSSAWIARPSASASALRSLLDPSQPLFAALHAVDSDALLRFLFPNERLPPRLRRLLLLADSHRPELLSRASPLFSAGRGIIAGQMQLNLFEYYVFWFAYYGAAAAPGADAVVQRRRWHHPFAAAPQHRGSCSLYLDLLDLYLTRFVKAHHLEGAIYVPGSAELSRGGVFILTLIEFWLLKDDPWPTQLGALNVEYTPPGPLLCDGVRLLVRHCHRLLRASMHPYAASHRIGAAKPFTSFLPRKIGGATNPPVDLRLLRKPLYRFISCAFSRWPSAIPLQQARYLVSVWVDYMQPWNADAEVDGGGAAAEGHHRFSTYSADSWQDYVTVNYPFYTALVARFLDLVLKSVRINVEAVLDMTQQVLSVLAGSKDLLDHLRKIEIHNPFMVLDGPSMEMDWDESCSIGDFDTHGHGAAPPTQKHMTHLFNNDVSQIFQMLILQAEVEIQYTPVEKQKDITKALECLKDVGNRVFDFQLFNSGIAFHSQPDMASESEDEHASFGRHTCFNAKYRGDWMRRPIETTEIAWLARVLVKLSDYINHSLGLDRWSEICETKELLHGENARADMLTEAVRDMVSFADLIREMKCFFMRCCDSLLSHLRQQGWRVNLRFLARKPFALLLLLLFAYWILKK